MKQNDAFLYLLIIAAVMLALSQGTMFAGVGFTTLQLSEVNFLDTNDPILKDKVWSLTVVPVGLSQWVEGQSLGNTFDNSLIEDDGYQSQRDIIIDIENHRQRCQYGIEPDPYATSIYNFGGQLYGTLPLGACDEAAIQADCSQYGTPLAIGKIGGSFNCACIYGTLASTQVATLPDEADRIYETDVVIRNGVNEYSATISNWDANFAMLGDIAYVKGIDIASGLSCPSGNQRRIVGIGNEWRLTSAAAYDTYKNQYDEYFASGQFPIYSVEAFWQLIDQLNLYSNAAQGEVPWCKSGYGCAQYDSGHFYFSPSKTVSNPIIQFYVKADWLGVIQPEGEPEMYCLETSKQIGGGGGALKFGIKNIGTGRGTATVSTTCDYPVTQDGGSIELSLQPQEYKESALGIKTSKVNEATTVTCVVKGQILSKTDTCNVLVTVNPDIVCTPLERTCRSNAIQECNQFGTAWQVVEQCEGSEVCQFINGVPQCASSSCTDCLPDECNCHAWDFICRAKCKLDSFAGGIGYIVIYIIILLAIIGIVVIFK